MISKKHLEIKVSKLSDYSSKRPGLEQYTTPSSVAGALLWAAYMNGDVNDKIVCDLGCGNGILGISALLLGAKKVFFVDIDPEAIRATKKNLESLKFRNYKLINKGVGNIDIKADVVVMNPPFGVQSKGIDISFFHEAMNTSPIIYAVYKSGGFEYVSRISQQRSFKCRIIKKMDLKLKKEFSFHRSRKAFTQVILLHLQGS